MQASIPSTRAGVVALIAAVALAMSALFGASAAEARPSQAASGSCVQAGIGTLQSLGLLQAAAQKKVDYSTLADPEAGPIFLDLEEGAFLSLGQVVKLHTSNPELFAWCR